VKSVPLTVKCIKVIDVLVTGKQLFTWTSGHSPLKCDLTCSQVSFIDLVLYTILIVSKQFDSDNRKKLCTFLVPLKRSLIIKLVNVTYKAVL